MAEQPTLEEYALGINNVNTDLQRQSAAYGHFREVMGHLRAIETNPNADRPAQLPFVIVRFPQEGNTPGEMKIDLNTLDPQTLAVFGPVFELLATGAGEQLLQAWENIGNVMTQVTPILTAAKQQQSG